MDIKNTIFTITADAPAAPRLIKTANYNQQDKTFEWEALEYDDDRNCIRHDYTKCDWEDIREEIAGLFGNEYAESLETYWTILIKRDTKLNHILGFLSQNLSLPVNYDISDEISGSTMRVSAGEALVVDQGNYFI